MRFVPCMVINECEFTSKFTTSLVDGRCYTLSPCVGKFFNNSIAHMLGCKLFSVYLLRSYRNFYVTRMTTANSH